MNLNIRHWLVENYIEISHIKGCSQGQMTGVSLRIVQDMEVKSPSPFDICTLAEVWEVPLGSAFYEVGIFARLTKNILGLLGRNKPFNRNEATWLAFQAAYLQALEEVLIEEQSLSRLWWERELVPLGQEEINQQGGRNLFANASEKPLQDERLQDLIKNLREEKLTDVQAEEALLMVEYSSFVEQISETAVAWLVANRVLEVEAELIIQRLKNKLLGHLIMVVSENATTLAQLQKFFELGNYVESNTPGSRHKSDDYLNIAKENYRANLITKLGEPLLMEYFSLKDIYVPLTGVPLTGNHQPVDLMKWVVSQLDNLETITVIESESGYGKTSFCQVLAARIAQKLYPEWIPVNICLSDISRGDNLQETLQSAFINNSEVDLSAWLNDSKTKCLLILDGLNELPNCADDKMSIAIFIQQIIDFQSQFSHKIILTSQSVALEDIFSKAASKLQRIKIQPWEQHDWKQWFANWSKVQSMKVAQKFFKFLKKNKAFSRKSHFLLADLVRQPLMLYLLAILHRDELLDDEILASATNPQITNTAVVLWKIYERLNQWLFGYPVRSISQKLLASSASGHIHRTPEAINLLTKNQHPQELIEEIQAVALQFLHSGKKSIHLESISLKSINLKADYNQLPVFYFSKEIYREKEKEYINSTMTNAQLPIPKTRFSHSKFGEYLCAASIVNKLKALTKSSRNNYGETIFAIDSPCYVAENIYHLLGYGILTREIEELVIEGLRQEQKHKFSFELLCSRLLPFWYAYCSGRWLDEGIAHTAWSYFKKLDNPINVEQVNAAVGINIFLLLSACYRETKRTFSPCGNPSSLIESHPQALTRLIAKTAVFHPDITRQRINEKSLTFLNLAKADLTEGMLSGVNFANTNLANVQLKDACLCGANLADVNLTGADLTGANLANANLTNAKLTGANLTGANLLGINLDLVNLSNACLFQAIIAESQKETAVANGAVFSLDKFEELKRLLSYQSQADDTDTGEKTEIAFNEHPSIGQIESAEGEPSMPYLYLDDYTEDETVLTTTDF
ncbi:pentapeptide repeat-containing protein [Calothrix parasitica NIES-267]|uniref:Pentapeptide repeat-containing protein n=1 Tax=Calothrix parasitica NIES-267 TaxID=1973488 RepID=A0A1Z4LWE2_9CYAN|nr:pentapeptide repeat-containing protein [Calothrix parasitica NIES-267]